MLLLSLLCCAKPEPAPVELGDLLHWFFLHYEDGTDEEIQAAAANLQPLVKDATRGLVTSLTDGEQATVALDPPRDPADATGMYVTGPVACAFGDYEKVHYALDQEGLYEAATGDESYIEYDREYTSDLDAYQARETPFLSWHTTYTVKPVMTEYTAEIEGGVRFVPDGDAGGPVVIDKAFLPSPATFTQEDTNDYFDQDYQLDVMLPDGDGSMHVYAVWRDLSSVGLTDESEGVQNLLLDGMEDFDRDTELVCAAGGF